MQKSTSPALGYRGYLDSLIQDDARYEALKRRLCRLLVLAAMAFIIWGIYFIHIIINYRLTITLR
jgi:uncharacterized membrane protein (DUF485 family)